MPQESGMGVEAASSRGELGDVEALHQQCGASP